MSTAPYDVPEAISELAKLIVSPAGQEAVLRLLADRGITLDELKALWAQDEKVDDNASPSQHPY